MTQNTKLGVGLVVLAALAGAVYLQKKKDDDVGSAHTTSAELPELKAPEAADKLEISNADKGSVTLEKKGEEWVLTKPLEARANQQAVKSLLDNLKELKAKEAIVGTATDEQKTTFDFAPAKAVHLVAFQGGEKKLDVTFGKSGARGQTMMVDGKPGIYAASGYSSWLYAKEVKGWRDAKIFDFDDTGVGALTLDRKAGKLAFVREGEKWKGTFKGAPLERFDEEKVKDALRALKALAADDFGDGKSPEETGLDAPDTTVTIGMKDGATKVLRLGKTSSGSNRYAQKEGEPTIYVVAQYAADWLVAEPSKYQKAADAGAPAAAPPGMGLPPGMQMPHGMPGHED